MVEYLKFINSDSHKLFFSSDFHLGHDKPWIVQKRGFKTREGHDDSIINKINEQARPQDSIIFVGDFCLNTTLEQFKEYTRRILCQNFYMISGNHNNPWWKFYKSLVFAAYGENVEVYPYRWNNIIFVGESLDMTVNSRQIVHASHFPKSIWDHQQHGAVHILGHSHGGFKETLPDYPDHKRLDVGWDIFKALVEFPDLIRIMNKKNFVKLDHHGKDTT